MAGIDVWQALSDEFDALRKEELSSDPANSRDRWLRAYSTNGIKQWLLSEGINENFRARFELLASRAGNALASGECSTRMDDWLCRLCLELKHSRSKFLFAQAGESVERTKAGTLVRRKHHGGVIRKVCEASAVFCTRLATTALERPAPASALSRTARPLLRRYRSELKRAILLQLTQNPNASDLEVCRDLDADGGCELPPRWKRNTADRLFVDVYLDSRRKNKVESLISKVRADMRKARLL